MSLDWGQATPEGANLDKNEFVYIYNHNLTSIEKVDRTIRFVIGRLNYYDKHLPKNPKHSIKFDIRGQKINESSCNFIVKELTSRYEGENLIKVDFIK